MVIKIDTSGITKLRLALTELPEIKPWFVVDAPWGKGDFIVSGHPDPHLGKYVADTQNFDDEANHAQEYAAFIAAANPVIVQQLLGIVDHGLQILNRSMSVMKALHESAPNVSFRIATRDSYPTVLRHMGKSTYGIWMDSKGAV